jgi:hypothetical protein
VPTAAEHREHQREESEQEHALLIALVVLLLAGLPFVAFARRLIALLATAGIGAPSTTAVLGLVGAGGLLFGQPQPTAGPAVGHMQRTGVTRRARYLLAASRRISEGASVDVERRLFAAHAAAENRRLKAAHEVDKVAAKHGPVVGWHAVRDGRTTAECFNSHGANFSALTPPAQGWPGTLHGGQCRCKAVAPWPGGTLLP